MAHTSFNCLPNCAVIQLINSIVQLLNGAIRLIRLFATHSICGNFIWHLSDTTRFAFDINCISLSLFSSCSTFPHRFHFYFHVRQLQLQLHLNFHLNLNLHLHLNAFTVRTQARKRGGGGVNGTELCKVIYQANISNKLVKYYVIKLSAHAQQQSDNAQRAQPGESGGWWGAWLAWTGICFAMSA